MSLFQKFIIFKHRLTSMISDEDKRLEDERFLRSVESIELTLKRSLKGYEYRILFTLDDPQAELVKNLLKEARTHETTRNP